MLEKIREAMRSENIDWLVVFSKDPHLSEYTARCDKYREAVSGFTGSAGTVVISENEAYLWTDMRYHLQASIELKDSGIFLMKYGLPSVPSMEDFLCEHIWDGQTLAFDLMTVSASRYRELKKRLPATVDIVDAHKLLRSCVEMPKRSFGEIVPVPDEMSGKSIAEKLDALRRMISKRYVNDESYTYVLSDLMSQMWLLNIRGCDIEYVPVAYSYTMITAYDVTVFVSRKSLSDEAKEKLQDQGINIKEYSTFYESLKDIATDVVLADPQFNNCRVLLQALDEGIFRECDDTVLIPKALKNDAEIKGMKSAHLKDAVTMIRFIKKLKEMAAEGSLTDEFSIGAMLDDMRLGGGCSSLSFETICAYADNCAIVHYGVTKEASKPVKSRGFLLVDSGG
ncbi:MAG: aminopeptidase P family N-terminal domain-containing protein, partial [Lachnospiraceae bacterium]|nr:aminopeptidase P family N-terminal domain-containing protein [Lachnospiraceae bacterium]